MHAETVIQVSSLSDDGNGDDEDVMRRLVLLKIIDIKLEKVEGLHNLTHTKAE